MRNALCIFGMAGAFFLFATDASAQFTQYEQWNYINADIWDHTATTNRHEAANCDLLGDATASWKVGPRSNPKDYTPRFPMVKSSWKSCSLLMRRPLTTPFSFVAVVELKRGVGPNSEDLNGDFTLFNGTIPLLRFSVTKEGVSLWRSMYDLGQPENAYKISPWDFKFPTYNRDGSGSVVVVGTVQSDGRLRIDTRRLPTGEWISTTIDSGWPLADLKTNTPIMPTALKIGNSDSPYATLGYFIIGPGAIMESPFHEVKNPLVNGMSAKLFSAFQQYSILDPEPADLPYLPCNSGHWLPSQTGERSKVGPPPRGQRLCDPSAKAPDSAP